MSIVSNIPIIGKLFRGDASKAQTYHGIDSVRRTTHIFYYPIRALFRAIAKTQHAEIEAIGIENIPPDGPVFLVGNHPNSLLDFLNLLAVVRHPVATAAKDTITNIPVGGYILKNYALMVPVARAQDKASTGISEEERVKANEKMIQDAVQLLVNGRLFNIYAEGRSTDSRKLNRIKLGFMALALQAERQFNYFLNLRIVPYGYFYDRINRFQSSVCIVFGKPFKIRNLIEMPEDFLALSAREQTALEKKIMVAGKQRLQADIENLITSIADPDLVPLIDDISAIYVLTPVKYMGRFQNVREKYILSKIISESIQEANKHTAGRERLRELRRLVDEYNKKLHTSHMTDALIRRTFSFSSIGYHLKGLLQGVVYSPLIVYGYIANYLPRLAGRLMRYWVIDVQKREKVDGDEQAIIAAFAAVCISYPGFGVLFLWLAKAFALPVAVAQLQSMGFATAGTWLAVYSWVAATGVAALGVYMMARLWRFSLFYGRRFKDGLFFVWDGMVNIIRRKQLRHMRELRHEIIDSADFIIGDYS